MKVMDKTMEALAASLNLRQMRQELISANIANAETPGYKSKRIDFEEALSRALNVDELQSLKVGDDKHFDVGGGGFDNLKPDIYDDPNGEVKPDGNTVDRDSEMAKLVENKLMYDAAVKLINKKLALKKYAISADR